MLTYSAQPDTLEQVQTEIQNWLDDHGKSGSRWFTFSRVPHKPTLRVFISHSSPDVKFEMKERRLLFQVKHQRLNLNLDKFYIRTAFENKKFCLDIDRDPAPEHRFLVNTLRQFAETKYPAFYTRVLRAVLSFEDDLSNTLIDEATSASTDHLVMVEALSSAPWVAELEEDDPLAAAKLRGLKRRQEMLKAAGETLTSEQVAEVLNLSRQAVDKRRSSNQLLALTQGKRGYSYPGFQFHEGKTLDGLESVLKALSAVDPWMQLNFFTSPNERLGGKNPIEALRKGKIDEVVKIASTYGEQGAQ
ncbi:hypothetical protein HNQ77_001648 [Silvibacterium bohemicum]|uniref:Antitoxin Xre/MbcA/ParS-like toxin-binding domain-containing protein n=1 Tax=Silvibacterium bohemicum TaxID=1577686 RepID=A0A841JVD0_9BACT|nr:hypothetical protein [Silvibacterium bohemicum]MBB6143699.1 hypothetical protein [Silvibacterium bohemicum]